MILQAQQVPEFMGDDLRHLDFAEDASFVKLNRLNLPREEIVGSGAIGQDFAVNIQLTQQVALVAGGDPIHKSNLDIWLGFGTGPHKRGGPEPRVPRSDGATNRLAIRLNRAVADAVNIHPDADLFVNP